MYKITYHRMIFILAAVLSSFIMTDVVSASGYAPGYVWGKAGSYTNGTVNNSTAGNPNLDSLGNPAWSYESFDKDLLNWDSSTLMPWYNNWRWAAGGGFVNVSKWDQNTHLDTNWNSTGLTSVVRWINPTGQSITVDLTGKLHDVWAGQNWVNGAWSSYFVASPANVRVILGYHDFSANTSTLLIDNTYNSPISSDTVCNTWAECPYIDTPLTRTLSLDAGDSLFWTTINLGSTPGKNRWVTTVDGSVRITMVPEPVSSTLFIIGAASIGFRQLRRKRQVV